MSDKLTVVGEQFERLEKQLAAAQVALLGERDECCKAICLFCRSDAVYAPAKKEFENGPYVHRFKEESAIAKGWFNCKAAEIKSRKVTEQPIDALRAFVLGLLPKDRATEDITDDSFYTNCGFNEALNEIRANLSNALEPRP